MDVEITEGKVYIGKWNPAKGNYSHGPFNGIKIDKNNSIMFQLQILNDQSTFEDINVNVYPSEMAHLDYEDDEGKGDEERKHDFASWVFNRIFFFRLYKSDNSERYTDNYVAKNITVVKQNKIFKPEFDFQIIPVINKSVKFPNRKEFESTLATGKAITFEHTHHLGKMEDIGSFLIFHEDIEEETPYSLGYLYEDVDATEIDPGYIRYAVPNNPNSITVRKIDTTAWMQAGYYNVPGYEDIVFIPSSYLKVEGLDQYTTVESQIPLKGMVETPMKTNNKQVEQTVTVEPKMLEKINELSIINQFKHEAYSKKYSLVLNPDDLVNLYLSIKTNTLTVLSGLSGTGKSKVITAFADALGILNDKQFKMISVRPSWQDDADLLGYADTMHNVYRPADAGLADILIDAAADPNHVYLIVLDEMNLARVEHYFSQFISVLEQDSKTREIQLYNSHLRNLYNGDRYQSTIHVGSNVRFVGTINIDESTFSLSDKLLDRANIIELQMVPFDKRKNFSEEKPFTSKLEKMQEAFMENIGHLSNNVVDNGLDDDELKFFWNLDKAFVETLPSSGFGWRTLVNMERFIASVPEKANFSRKKAIDYQLAQRILPKLRGTNEMLDNLLKIENGVVSGKLIKMLDENGNISDFTLSRKVLTTKAKELQVTGFVS